MSNALFVLRITLEWRSGDGSSTEKW